MFWGMTPALDIQLELQGIAKDKDEEINILIVGGCDARHVLKTLAQAHRHVRRQLNFFLIDGCPELVARQLLLLTISFEQPARIGLLEKTRMFLEVYGNIILRPSTSRYLTAKSKELIKMITNLEYLDKLLPMISLEQVKYRERDYMETLLKLWTTGHSNQFNVCELWDRKLRDALGTRYDHRQGVFDWDYHMRLKEVGGKRICPSEYKHFREHGVPFTWLETEVCRPNCTFAAGVFACGRRFVHRGYLGDATTGPFIAYGTECEDQDMLKSANGVNFKRATDLSERNIMRMFYELETGEEFDSSTVIGDTEHNLGSVVVANIDAKLSEDENERPLKLIEDENTYINVGHGRINFLSLSALEHYPNKPQFEKFFDVMYVGHNTLNRVHEQVFKMVRPAGLVIFESRRNVISLTRDDIKSFGQQINDLALAGKCVPLGKFDPQADDYARFVMDYEE